MTFETIIFEKQAELATITLNRPKALNALNQQMMEELTAALKDLEADAEVRVLILTGGEKVFGAGADLKMIQNLPAPAAAHAFFTGVGGEAFRKMATFPKPAIAAVAGFALGGGCELALACDFIYASDKARIGQPEVNLGIMPGFGGTQRLARRVGLARARELIYTGDHVTADKALAIGLVNEVVPHAELMDRVRAVAKKIASKAPVAIAYAKRVMQRGYDTDLAVANELEATAFSALFDTEDMREGTKAFVEKRAASFKGK